jgi:flagellin
MSVINTNVPSLSAANNVYWNNHKLASSMNKLATGLRINSAKDDAAGLAISEKMTSQINGYNQGTKNALDAISLLQIADGSLKTIIEILQRIRELCVQAANGIYNAANRSIIQSEINQDIAEIERTLCSAVFNGVNIFDGSILNSRFQVGPSCSCCNKICVTIPYVSIDTVGCNKLITNGTLANVAITSPGINNVVIDSLTIMGSLGNSAPISIPAGSIAKNIARLINLQSSATGVKACAQTALMMFDIDQIGTFTMNLKGTGSALIGFQILDLSDLGPLANAINQQSAVTNIVAILSLDLLTVVLKQCDGLNISINNFSNGSDITVVSINMQGVNPYTNDPVGSATTISTDSGFATVGGNLSFGNCTGQSFIVANSSNSYFSPGGNQVSQLRPLACLSVVDGGCDSICLADCSLSAIDLVRTYIGSMQNRFEFVVGNNQVVVENFSASRSRIIDTDYAVETSKLAREQVLSQAGLAMLQQSNCLPPQLLQLLKGCNNKC